MQGTTVRPSGREWVRSLLAAGALSMPLLWSAAAPGADVLELPLETWTFTRVGNFTGSLDRRQLYQISHPIAAARAGDCGQVTVQATVPKDAQAPYTLRFYVSDNIYGDALQSWAIADLRRGHRFERVLVDGSVIWSQDIAVSTPLTDPKYTLVDLTPHVQPGQAFALTLQLWQEIDSDRKMPEDLIRLGIYAGTTTQYTPMAYAKYGTRSYWGDIAIHAGAVPSADELKCQWLPQLKRRDTAPPRVEPAVREQSELALEMANLLAAPWSWPVTQGFPLPMGALKDVSGVALRDAAGAAVSADLCPLSRWPDGTLRWVLADFALPPGAAGNWRLEWGSGVTSGAASPMHPVRTEDTLAASNGLVWAQWAQDAAGTPQALTIGCADGPALVTDLRGYMNFRDKALTARWQEGRWVVRTAQRAEMLVSGELAAADGDRFGSCQVRLTLFADTPFFRLAYRIINERTEPVADDAQDPDTIKRAPGLYGVHRPVTAHVVSYGLGASVLGATLQQDGGNWLVVGGGQGGALACTVRDFERIPPIGLECGDGEVDVQLFKPGAENRPAYRTYAGEAKTHEVWLALAGSPIPREVAANLSARVDAPPRLNSSALIRDTCVWGAVPRVGGDAYTAEYALILERFLSPYYAGTPKGIRRCGWYPGNNFYWNRLHSIYLYYAMTGERKWFDMAERANRHYMDICTVNWSEDDSMLGVKIRNIDKFFRISVLIQNAHPLFDHWNLTGDPDALRLGRGNVDGVMRNEKMLRESKGGCSRAQGWPIMNVMRGWQETGEQRYLDHATMLVDIALGNMEDRRGAYLHTHGSHSHLGIVPFMTGILCTGLRQYHYWTGDERAAVCLVQNAEAMFAEMHDPACSKTLPNLDYYYSPNPYLNGATGTDPNAYLNPNIASAQAYAAVLMDDPKLADIAWRTWQAYMQTAGWERNAYDYLYDLHAALYWLDQAPVPDRTPQVKVGRMWRHAVGAQEIWLNRPDSRPFEATVRWTAHERPYQRSHRISRWPQYCERIGLRGELRVLDSQGTTVAATPMDFTATPRGTTAKLSVGSAGGPGLYRIIVAGAREAPVNLILDDISPHLQQWGVPIDRGWLNQFGDCYFRIPDGCRELSLRYGLLTPWEKVVLELRDAAGKRVREDSDTQRERWRTSWLEWTVPVPAGEQGKVWSFRQSPPLSAILRIDGITPLVHPTASAVFAPDAVPAPDTGACPAAPPGWDHEVIHIEAGKTMAVPRGLKTGAGVYEHVHVHRGTIEFWLRADTSDAGMDNLTLFSFGSMRLWRRTQTGTYLNLGKGMIQSGFLIRPQAWYHLAMTWDFGADEQKPTTELYVNGIPMTSLTQTPVPVDLGDWTGDALSLGTAAPMHVSGLRISAAVRDEELQQGLLSPPPDKYTLYWQHADEAH